MADGSRSSINNKNALTAAVGVAWRLDREMKGRLILHETGFSILAKGFLLPTNRRRDFLFVSELI